MYRSEARFSTFWGIWDFSGRNTGSYDFTADRHKHDKLTLSPKAASISLKMLAATKF